MGGTGRPAKKIHYCKVQIHDEYAYVAQVHYKDGFAYFVFDEDDYEEVSKYSWHVTAKNYIGTGVTIDESRKSLYLHNLVMDHITFAGKGATETVDHISRNGFDNRKKNLRILTQTFQNMNQKQKERVVTLPDNCGVDPKDIPKHIWYVHANGLHGDRFAIEFKTEGILWKSTSSKKVTLQEKLVQAKQKLEHLYQTYPYLNPNHEIETKQALEAEYQAIVAAAKPHFPSLPSVGAHLVA